MTERDALSMLLACGYSLAWQSSKLQRIEEILAELPEGTQAVSVDYGAELIRIWGRGNDRVVDSPLWIVSRRKIRENEQ